MNHEEKARNNHRCGCNCAQSVFAVFADRLGVTTEEAMRMAPKPRSDGGKCGAFLAGKLVVERLKPEAVDEYEQAFVDLNGATQCALLVAAHKKLRKKCNDYVGDAARLAEKVLK